MLHHTPEHSSKNARRCTCPQFLESLFGLISREVQERSVATVAVQKQAPESSETRGACATLWATMVGPAGRLLLPPIGQTAQTAQTAPLGCGCVKGCVRNVCFSLSSKLAYRIASQLRVKV